MPLQYPEPVEINEPTPVQQRIAWWIENAFVRIFKRVFNALKNAMQDLLAFAYKQFIEDAESGLLADMAPLLDEMQSYDDLPGWVRQTIANARSGEHQGAIVLLGAVAACLAQVLARGASEAVSPIVVHRLNAIFRAQLSDPISAVEMYRRKIITRDDLLHLTRANGWPDWQTDNFLQIAQRLTPESMLLPGYWRNLVSEAKLDDVLDKSGYSAEDIQLWKDLSERIPSPAELISIAVREGFDDAVARQFGYDEAFPSDAAEAAEKGGLQQEWFRRLWRAHWRLPSVTQGFDMFHRAILSRQELELLLRAADIPSFWRDKLIQLSYNVITRVDVRRMYALKVFTEEEVYNRYVDYGYSPDDAEALTEWTVKEYAEEERQLTKADILRLYRESIITEQEAVPYLEALNFGPAEIGLLLTREDFSKIEEYEQEVVENVKAGFIASIFDDNDVRQQLGQLNPPAGFIDDKLSLWRLEKARRVIRPTVSQLRDMWQSEVITDHQLEVELKGRGYTDTYIEWYKTLWTSEE
jgi:hypothetical protein